MGARYAVSTGGILVVLSSLAMSVLAMERTVFPSRLSSVGAAMAFVAFMIEATCHGRTGTW